MKLSNRIFISEFPEAVRNLKVLVLPVGVSYKIITFLKELEANAAIYDEARMLLVNKYGEKNDDGELNKNEDGTVPLVDAEGFQKEFNELLEIEQKYKFKKIKLPEDVEISVNDLMLLEDILEIG